MKKLRIIARNSTLSQLQVTEVMNQLPSINYEVIFTSSYGDNNQQISLLNGEAPADIFTRELDQALLDGTADIAIHSAKDLPYPLPPQIEVIALLEAKDLTDSLVSNNNLRLAELPENSIVGTSSPLRKKELLSFRPDLIVKGIRGTIEQRIQQVREKKYDAAIIATCALQRLGLESEIAEILPFETNPLQGMLAITALRGKDKLKEQFTSVDVLHTYGMVTLIGFGPGDYELLTVKAMKALQAADVIVYDDLIDKDFLVQLSAKKIYVGKRSGHHSSEQNEINHILLREAKSGKNVIRLKGGDPMIFAHAGEEIEFLQKNFVSVSVIPGITTASALAADMKVSLTQRKISSSVAFVNGHSHFLEIPTADTLIFYMGAANLNIIAQKILAKGWAKSTPVLLVHNVSLPSEQSFSLSLEEMANITTKFPTPLIALVGDVSKLRNQESSTITRTLYTGTICNNPTYIHTPLIEIQSLSDYSYIKSHLLQPFEYLLFTSRYTVQYTFKIVRELKIDISSATIVSIGKTTTEALLQEGVSDLQQVAQDDSYGVIDWFAKQPKGIVVYPRSAIAFPIIFDGLQTLGFTVHAVPVYTTICPSNPRKVNLDTIQKIVFTSPSTIDNFIKVYGELPKDKEFITRGSITKSYLESKLQENVSL